MADQIKYVILPDTDLFCIFRNGDTLNVLLLPCSTKGKFLWLSESLGSILWCICGQFISCGYNRYLCLVALECSVVIKCSYSFWLKRYLSKFGQLLPFFQKDLIIFTFFRQTASCGCVAILPLFLTLTQKMVI